ncbi:MAG: response regulator transcription factor [Actinobacteria bacterium]|nr:response regulator transcription factor [Actinomycetota bacterium]
MPTALLLAEHEPGSRGRLERNLREDGFDVVGASGAGEALELAELAQPALVLLAHPLPDASALDLCRRIRQGEPGRCWDREVPVIVLGPGDADADDRVRAFARGCDDYVGSPFVYDELLARIRAVLRRSGSPPAAEWIEAGEIAIDRATRWVTVRGQRVALAGKEYELLLELASDPTRVFTKEQLLRDVWGYRLVGRTRTLDSHASRLRRKLGSAGEGPFVVNVWGVGYRLLDS